MKHDPLCPLCGMTTIDLAALRGLSKRTLRRIEASSISCQCDLIGKVREEIQAEVDNWRSLCAEQGDAYDEGVAWGRAEAIAAAVNRVDSIPDPHWLNPNLIAAAGNKAQVIAAIKGEQT